MRVWDLGLGFGVWGLRFGVRGLGFGVWGLGNRVWGLEFGVWSLGFGVRGLGFGVWSLGFEIGGLGFGVRGLRTRLAGTGCRAHQPCLSIHIFDPSSLIPLSYTVNPTPPKFSRPIQLRFGYQAW